MQLYRSRGMRASDQVKNEGFKDIYGFTDKYIPANGLSDVVSVDMWTTFEKILSFSLSIIK